MARIRVMAACLPEIACVPQRDGVLFFDPAIMISEEFDAAGVPALRSGTAAYSVMEAGVR